ncbi:hypothetical protein [Halorubrum tibetense]|uniref:Uncharacterized protein n=1 Tax=Halorubrum tibetense TaxID=175631 RepID=A0ABD5SB79_9EURY
MSRSDSGGNAGGGTPGLGIPSPEAVLGTVPTDRSVRVSLAAAARSRGRTASLASEIAQLREEIASITVPTVDLQSARRQLADATGEEGRLKERVATIRGDVRARRAVDADTAASIAELQDAAAALSVAQTDRIAAEQGLEQARRRAKQARDERERRLRLTDRLRNRRRDARTELANSIYPAFREALPAVPEGDLATPGRDASEYEGSRVAASLAAVRIASIDGPVSLSPAVVSAFESWDGPPAERVLGVRTTRPEL